MGIANQYHRRLFLDPVLRDELLPTVAEEPGCDDVQLEYLDCEFPLPCWTETKRDLLADLPKFISAVIIAGINYAVTGRKEYEGPVAYIRKDL